MNKTCKNCNSHFKGYYCYNCGQAAHIDPLTFSYLRDNILHVFHIEHKIPYTLKELTFRPGHAIREYIEGKRGKYVNPFSYLAFAGLLYWLAVHLTGGDALSLITPEETDSEELKRRAAIANDVMSQFLHGKYAPLVRLPFIAFATWLAFIKSGANYIKHIVLNAYVNAQIILPQIVFLIIEHFCKNEALAFTPDIIYLVYLCWVLNQFFNHRSKLRIILLTLLSVFLIFIMGVMFFAIGFGYVFAAYL